MPGPQILDVRTRHCNKRLNLKDEIVTGKVADDGFYLLDGGELSYNWDIIGWREHSSSHSPCENVD